MVVEILIRLIEGLEHELDKAYRRLAEHFPWHRKCRHHTDVRQALIVIFNNQKYIIMDPVKLRLDKNFHLLAVLLNASTGLAVPGATKVLKSVTSSDLAIAAVDENNDVQPVALGAAQVTVVNTWSYQDENTGEPVTSDQTTVLDVQVVVGPEGVLQVVTVVPFDKVAAPAADVQS